MVVRACILRRFSYSTDVQDRGPYFTFSLVLSILIFASQLGSSVVTGLDASESQRFLGIPLIYVLIPEYTALSAGWFLGCYIIYLQYRTQMNRVEACLVLFWGYFLLLHLALGVLRIISVPEESDFKSSCVGLHFFSSFVCGMLLVCACLKPRGGVVIPVAINADSYYKGSVMGGVEEPRSSVLAKNDVKVCCLRHTCIL